MQISCGRLTPHERPIPRRCPTIKPFLLSPVPLHLAAGRRTRHRPARNRPAPAADTDAAPDLLTVPEAADLLDVRPQTIHEWKRRGLLTYRKLGRRTYLKRAEVLAAPQAERRTAKASSKKR